MLSRKFIEKYNKYGHLTFHLWFTIERVKQQKEMYVCVSFSTNQRVYGILLMHEILFYYICQLGEYIAFNAEIINSF